jgi:GntR family transcriptional regulator
MRLVELGAIRLIQAVDIVEGAVGYIKAAIGIEQVGWRERIVVRVPDANETGFFNLPDDGRIAVLEFARTGYDQTGEPIRVTITTYPADRNQFVMTSGKVPDEPPVADEQPEPDEQPGTAR